MQCACSVPAVHMQCSTCGAHDVVHDAMHSVMHGVMHDASRAAHVQCTACSTSHAVRVHWCMCTGACAQGCSAVAARLRAPCGPTTTGPASECRGAQRRHSGRRRVAAAASSPWVGLKVGDRVGVGVGVRLRVKVRVEARVGDRDRGQGGARLGEGKGGEGRGGAPWGGPTGARRTRRRVGAPAWRRCAACR